MPNNQREKPRCVVCDIDGTIADTRHRLHFLSTNPKNWKAFYDAMGADAPHNYIIELLQQLKHESLIVLSTGRPENYRDATIEWLDHHSVPYDMLLMRGEGDFRPDHVVKKEMLSTIREKYSPWVAIDDRPEVVQLWRNNDLPCLAVDNSPWYEPPRKDADTTEWLEWLGKQHHDDRFTKAADEMRQLRSRLNLAEQALGGNEP